MRIVGQHVSLPTVTCFAAHRSLHATAWLTFFVSLSAAAQHDSRPLSDITESRLCAYEQVVYNDNVFLLGSGVSPVPLDGQNGKTASRSDVIYHTGLCADGVMHVSDQVLVMTGEVEDQRFTHNDALNYVAGNANLQWNWRTFGGWYGEAGGRYERALGSFRVDRPQDKDLVDAGRYHLRIQHDLGARLSLDAGGERTETSHHAESRKSDNYRNDQVNGGLTFTSRAGNYLGVSAERDKATYVHDLLLNDVLINRDYRENKVYGRFLYAFTDQTLIKGTAGNIKREYLHADAGQGYSGATWHADLKWQPRERIGFGASAWKELSAYFDSESDHFIERGYGVSSNWSPANKWTLTGDWRRTQQRYITRSLIQVDSSNRRDDVDTGTLSAAYQVGDHLSLGLQTQYAHHTSTIAVYGYNNVITALMITGQM